LPFGTWGALIINGRHFALPLLTCYH